MPNHTRLGTRTGQGRQPRSGRASSASLDAEHFQSIRQRRVNTGVLLSSQARRGATRRVLTGRTEESSLIGREARAATLYSVRSTRGSARRSSRCASAAKLRDGGPILGAGAEAMRLLGHHHLGLTMSADRQALVIRVSGSFSIPSVFSVSSHGLVAGIAMERAKLEPRRPRTASGSGRG